MLHIISSKLPLLSYRYQDLTTKFYGSQVLNHLRTEKQEAAWKEFFQRPSADQSLLEGTVLISQWAQINEEQLPTLAETEKSIEKITQRVTELMGKNSNQKSPKEILLLINQDLFEEMGFQIRDNSNEPMDNFLIDKVHFNI